MERCHLKRAIGCDVWSYAEANIDLSQLINEAMACDGKLVVSAIVEGCSEAFDGVEIVVDAGGRNGTTMAMLINVSHVVSTALECDGIKHVGGDMLQSVPKRHQIS